MIVKKDIRRQVLSLLLLSLGGWLLHQKIHPVTDNPANYLPFVLGLLNIIAAPILFNSKKTVVVAYLVNGIGVILGTIAMTHLSLTGLPYPLTISSLLTRTTLPDILILFPKLLIGHSILLHYYPSGMGRLFTPAWWTRHFGYFTIAYALGYFILR